MSYTDPSTDILASLTDRARTYIARATMGDIVFQVIGFGLGRGGYTPANFIQTTPLVLTATELDDKVFPDAVPLSYEPFIETEEASPTVRVYNCRVGVSQFPGPADYGIGELALYGQILQSLTTPLEIGTVFVYALSHFPVVCKTRRDTFLRRVIVSY
jgi:hypothetical protein